MSDEVTKWALSSRVVLSEEGIEIFKHKSRPKQKKVRDFFKLWATPLTILVAVAGLLWGVIQFGVTQTDNARAARESNQSLIQQELNAEHLQATQVAANADLQATQVAASAKQTLDQQRQDIFNTYLDRMSDLLLIYHLQTARPGSPVAAIAEARTLTTLKYLDSSRQADLVHFLWKAGLVIGNHPVISLNSAPLKSVVFQHFLLYGINLAGALLIKSTFDDCDLHGAIFTGAVLLDATLNNVNLSGANMTQDDLNNATLENATLTGVNLTKALLINASLSGDDLTKINLKGASLAGADLAWADLKGANLSGDDLTKVNLKRANLAGADLKGAKITPAQLKHVASLQGAILPDGSKHP